jgi:putative peptide zinc metalloprotease protein
VAFAGPFASLMVVVGFGLIWWLSPVGGFWHGISSRMLLVYNFITFLNFIPFVQLDGYFMLCHALGLSELRKESHAYVKQTLKRKLFNKEEAVIAGYTDGEKRLFMVYGVCSVITTVCLLGLMIAYWYYMMSKRMGSGQAALVVLMILFGLVIRWKGRALWGKLLGRWRAQTPDEASAVGKT